MQLRIAAALACSFALSACHRPTPPTAPPRVAPTAPAARTQPSAFVGVSFSPVADFLAGCLPQGWPTGPSGPSGGEDAICPDQRLVQIQSARVTPGWRRGGQAYLVVEIVSPKLNTFYTGVRVRHATAGVTPQETQAHPSNGLQPGVPLSMSFPFEAAADLAPGTPVHFTIRVSPGEDCAGIATREVTTVVR
jgi:hypothetical protein